MQKHPIKKRDFFKRVKTNYRVVFVNDESLQEVVSFRLSMGKLYVFFSTLFVITVVLTTSVLLLTPLKYYIPGYGNSKMYMQVIKLKKNMDSLSDLVSAQQLYEANIKKVINGNYSGKSDTALLDMNQVKKEAMNIFPKPGK